MDPFESLVQTVTVGFEPRIWVEISFASLNLSPIHLPELGYAGHSRVGRRHHLGVLPVSKEGSGASRGVDREHEELEENVVALAEAAVLDDKLHLHLRLSALHLPFPRECARGGFGRMA